MRIVSAGHAIAQPWFLIHGSNLHEGETSVSIGRRAKAGNEFKENVIKGSNRYDKEPCQCATVRYGFGTVLRRRPASICVKMRRFANHADSDNML